MFILIWFTFGGFARAAISSTCWTAAGQVAPHDEPCYPGNPKHSVCCPAGAVCSANKICILPYGGQAHRGSCTDRTWGRECPHFCLSEHTGDDGLTGVNMTICQTDRSSTTYCCNDWTGRRCDCANTNTPRVILNLFEPLATIAADNADIAQTGEYASTLNDIPWNTVGAVLVAVMTLCILSMLLYLVRMTYIAKGAKDPTRSPIIVEHGRRFSDFFWNPALEENARGNSKFSIGTMDTDDLEKDMKLSTKSVRFSVGERSRSEGSQNVVTAIRTEKPPSMSRNDAFTKRPSRRSLTGTAMKSLPKLVVGRPTFKRQDTDFNVLTDTRRDSTAVAPDMLRVPS